VRRCTEDVLAHDLRSGQATYSGTVRQQRQEFISDGRRGGHDNDLVHPGAKALPNIARYVGLPGLDLEGSPPAISLGHKVDGLAATHGIFLGHVVAAGPQVLGQPLLPVPVLWSAQSVGIRFVDAERRFPGAGQRQYFDSLIDRLRSDRKQ
jgi:hypothetical protein